MPAPPRASTDCMLCFLLVMLYRITATCRVRAAEQGDGSGFFQGANFFWCWFRLVHTPGGATHGAGLCLCRSQLLMQGTTAGLGASASVHVWHVTSTTYVVLAHTPLHSTCPAQQGACTRASLMYYPPLGVRLAWMLFVPQHSMVCVQKTCAPLLTPYTCECMAPIVATSSFPVKG
jgi:hypothetical protein